MLCIITRFKKSWCRNLISILNTKICLWIISRHCIKISLQSFYRLFVKTLLQVFRFLVFHSHSRMRAFCHLGGSFNSQPMTGRKVIKVNTLPARVRHQRNALAVNALLLLRDRWCILLPSYGVEIRVRFLSKRLLEGIWRKVVTVLCCFVRHFVAAAIWKEASSGIRSRDTIPFTAKATIKMYTTSQVPCYKRKFV